MNSKLASLLCCLIMLVSFSGCTKVTQLVKDRSQPKRNCSQKSTKSIAVMRAVPLTQLHTYGITMTPLMPRNQPIISLTPTANTMQPKN